MPSTLIPPEVLLTRGSREDAHGDAVVIVDCRFVLGDPAAGRRAYEAGHVPGAHFADLEHDMSGPVIRGVTGRHPLPDPEALATTLRGWGVSRDSLVVAYDADTGSMAARLWWLLRWLGHDRVVVCDGGYRAWLAAGGEPSQELPTAAPGDFVAKLRPELALSTPQIAGALGAGTLLLLDARAPERFRGEVEPIDPVAGHIPGARCLPFSDNLEGGRFRSAPQIAERFLKAIGDARPEAVVAYCGSGVTACHHVLAAEHAGLGTLRLYPGSFSEWITDPRRPIATGE